MAERFNMLIVSSDTYPPTRVDVSVLFARELAHRGHTLDWILQSEVDTSTGFAVSWGGGTAWVGRTDCGGSLRHRIRKHVLGIANDTKLFGVLRRGNYDAIQVKDKFIAGIFAAIAARLVGVAFIYWLSYPFPEDYLLRARDPASRYRRLYFIRGTIFRWLLYRFLLRAAHHVFVQSEQMRKDIAKQGIPIQKMSVVSMGIDVSAFDAALREPARTIAPHSIVYLGTLARVRRLDFLLRVFARVRARCTDSTLYLVGAGNDNADIEFLKREAMRLDVASNVIFTGQLPWSEALTYVRAASVCVSPFLPTPVLNSTSPTKLVEYMALEKPVVGNDHPEQRLVIQESGGGLCVPWDEEVFAVAILELLRDPERAAMMGKEGKKYAHARRSYQRIADGVEKEILNVTRTYRARRASRRAGS